jgi:hypothetical protein
MAITIDASTAGPNTTASSATFSHTCAGSDRHLAVEVGWWTGGVSISSITYNGVSLASMVSGTHEGSNGFQAIWGLVAPATGANNVVVTFSASCEHAVGATSRNGVDQTTPAGSSNTASGSSTGPTVDVSSASGEVVIDVCSAFSTTFAQGTGQTERWDLGNSGGIEEAASSDEAGAATVTMSWTLGTSRQWGMAAVALKPSSGGTTITASAIASAEAFGTASVNLSVAPSSITTLEAFGTANVGLGIAPGGIASLEAFGSHAINLSIVASGIASLEAFGGAVVSLGGQISPTGIASLEAFGTAKLNLSIVAAAIASLEAFGAARVGLGIAPSGIASLEVFGTPTLQGTIFIITVSIPTGEAFGSTIVSAAFLAVIASGRGRISPMVTLHKIAARVGAHAKIGSRR